MSRRERLIAKIRARPPGADFNDVRRLPEEFGWKLDRQKGSHCAFTKAGERTLIVAQKHGRKVNRACLTEICNRLGLDD